MGAACLGPAKRMPPPLSIGASVPETSGGLQVPLSVACGDFGKRREVMKACDRELGFSLWLLQSGEEPLQVVDRAIDATMPQAPFSRL